MISVASNDPEASKSPFEFRQAEKLAATAKTNSNLSNEFILIFIKVIFLVVIIL
jgi:hypothetical protein